MPLWLELGAILDPSAVINGDIELYYFISLVSIYSIFFLYITRSKEQNWILIFSHTFDLFTLIKGSKISFRTMSF